MTELTGADASTNGELDLRRVGERIEELLDGLRAGLGRADWHRVEEVTRLVTELYGGGLRRILDIVGGDDAVLAQLRNDDLVASLLVIHDLYPLTLLERVEGAIESIRPYLGSHGGDVRVLSVDDVEGSVLLRMLGSCDGCPSSAVTLERAVRQAIEEAAPEIVRIEVEGAAPPAAPEPAPIPIQLVTKPVTSGAGVAVAR